MDGLVGNPAAGAEFNLGEVIALEEGFRLVKDQGVDPFLALIETGEREFFRAKDFVALYHLVFKMCIQRDPHNWSEDMYQRYQQCIEQYVEGTVVPALEKASKEYATTYLRVWVDRWQKITMVVRGLAKVFTYLDRFYTPNTDNVLPLKEEGYRIYKEKAFDRYSKVAANYALAAIEKERNGDELDGLLLQRVVNVFVEMGHTNGSGLRVYKADLEEPLLRHAAEYYKRTARSWLDGDSCPNYLEKAEQCLTAERTRVETYLNHATLDPLVKACHDALLADCQAELLAKNTGIDHLLTANSASDLARLFRLYERYPEQLAPIANAVEEHVRRNGEALVDTESKADSGGAGAAAKGGSYSLVRSLIELHDRYATIVRESFQNSQIFQRALKRAFEAFINQDTRVSRMLARYVNEVLRKHSKVKTRDIDSTLGNIVFLYGYITEKDIFERDYQMHLARRLLHGECESEHFERSMIAKLKTESGYQWTNKLEGMFNDVQQSKEQMMKFRSFFDTERECAVQLDVSVCTSAYWPSHKYKQIAVPHVLERACEKFKEFYLRSHSGHKLEWRMDQGQAEVQVQFSRAVRRTIICSTFQMAILLAFSDTKTPLTYKHILDVTGIQPYDIARHLLSLVHPQVRILLKKPNVKELEMTDKFMINPKFTCQTVRVTVPLLNVGDNSKRQTEEEAAIAQQRQHQVDAAIVRVMKTRKTLKHAALVGEVVTQLRARFDPKPQLIKRRIEAMIEQEYLERGESDRSTYNYLA